MTKKKPSKKKPARRETFWQFVERTSAEVAKWPAWKFGGVSHRKARP